MKPGVKPRGTVTLSWSPQFAYAVGLFTADGSLSKNGRHLDFTSKDRVQVALFKECLALKVKIGTKRSGNGGRAYRVQFGDVLFYKFLASIGLMPAKSLILKSLEIPDEYFADFLRGYFDGDGSSYSFYDSIFPDSYRFYVSFVSGSKDFTDWLRGRIQKAILVHGHVVPMSKSRCFQLKYSKREALQLCSYMYYQADLPCLKRKYLKVQRSLRIINQSSRSGEIGKHAAFRTQCP